MQSKEVSKHFWKTLLAMGLSACYGFALPGISQEMPQEMPQQVQFSDQVTKSPLTRVGAAEQAQLNHRIHALEKKGEHLRAWFTTQVSGNNRAQILFADHTPFQLTLSAGSHFKVLDADARDGQASIQLPEGVLSTYFQLQGKKQNSSQLGIEEGLYHVKDVLNRTHWGQWMQWGARLLPIPQAWHNDEGESLVLQLQPTDLASFQMVWLAESEKAPFPPGVNEIGPEGGVVELPGVGKLEIPEGAVLKNTIVVLKQIQSSLEPVSDSPEGEYASHDFLTPVVRIEPFKRSLLKSGLLYLEMNRERLGSNSPLVTDWKVSENNQDWLGFSLDRAGQRFQDDKAFFNSRFSGEDKYNQPVLVPAFFYYAKFIKKDLTPDSKGTIETFDISDSTNSFSTQVAASLKGV